MLEEAQKTLTALGIDQEEQLNRLSGILAEEDRQLLQVFVSTHSDAGLLPEELAILADTAGAGAGAGLSPQL